MKQTVKVKGIQLRQNLMKMRIRTFIMNLISIFERFTRWVFGLGRRGKYNKTELDIRILR